MEKEINLYILRNKYGGYIGKGGKVTTTPTVMNYWLKKMPENTLKQMKIWNKVDRSDYYWEKVKYIYKGTYNESVHI